MSRILFVDDEPVILNSMIANDWASIGIQEVFKAASGLEAVEILKSTPIDIVVTDIRMPGMDGLQLCKHIQKNYPRTKFILLSGYGEFEYAQKAIRYGTMNYLLKPIKDEELIEEVRRVKQMQQEEWERLGSLKRAERTVHTHLPLLRATLLDDMLTGMRLPNGLLTERMREYGLSFEIGSHCAMLIARLNDAEQVLDDAELYEFAVYNIASEVLEKSYEVWYCKDASGYLCFLLQDKHNKDASAEHAVQQLEMLADDIITKVAYYLKGDMTVLVGAPRLFPLDIVDQYRKLLNALRKIPYSEHGLIVSTENASQHLRSLEALYQPPTFQQLFEAGRWEDAQQKLQAIDKEVQEKQWDTEEHVNEIAYTLMNAFIYTAHQQGQTLLEMVGFAEDMTTEPELFNRVAQVIDWGTMVIDNLAKSNQPEFMDSKAQHITRIHRYIEENIAGDISLQAIADHVDLHPAYLSSLYKLEMNENISDFIMRYRMEKAALRLRTTNIKIYELSKQLGFYNPPYFSKLFKYYYGITPQQYRNRNQAQP